MILLSLRAGITASGVDGSCLFAGTPKAVPIVRNRLEAAVDMHVVVGMRGSVHMIVWVMGALVQS
ncbi:hypothetical protein P691DRAFT_800822 [Macrolepiota fuliginosa MF-IS2]|uniref:Uncharacterized protein n=1 Tax=Macrolepiota fuliginosa MF-IS2 TaxID=1400762 RepID=A0A9P5XDR6_9AGAR|nr:hypothetical protein P691DRAFT_800822 [Macrolepiota fuliginosa MF-IS2]